ncbi:MAG: HAD-IC family P-type ATPase, partial [Pirellulaceae bacterium]|nr:HAD-IC family P-type ATPase [Pirellulaceae bacterium]
TLTEGRPKLVSVFAADGPEAMGANLGDDADSFLAFAAALEKSSEHPLAGAIVAGAIEKGHSVASSDDFASHTGKGITGNVGGRAVAVGNEALMTDLGIGTAALADRGAALRDDGQTVMYVVLDGRLVGLLGLADPVKQSTPEALRMLAAEGVRVVMITGDNVATAVSVASSLGIEEFEAEVLPEGKSAAVERLIGAGHVVAMAGDGINDAPALAKANVGIAMGTGSDVAIESADVTLVKGDLRGIVRAIRLSRTTMKNIRQNLFFAFVYNSLGVPLAAGILYPLVGLLLSPMIAAAAMTLSSVSVITNALRLRNAEL